MPLLTRDGISRVSGVHLMLWIILMACGVIATPGHLATALTGLTLGCFFMWVLWLADES